MLGKHKSHFPERFNSIRRWETKHRCEGGAYLSGTSLPPYPHRSMARMCVLRLKYSICFSNCSSYTKWEHDGERSMCYDTEKRLG